MKRICSPPEKPKVRGLDFERLNLEQQRVVKEIADLVKKDDQLDLKLRDGYLNVYYRGGSLWKVSGLSRRARGIRISFDDKYFKYLEGSSCSKAAMPSSVADLIEWQQRVPFLKSVMDAWFNDYKKDERGYQQALSVYHRKNHRSPWIVIDVEYAAWLHGQRTDGKVDGWGRRLCRFDIVAVERKNFESGLPLVLHVVEFKQGCGALNGKSGVRSHAEDIAQFFGGPHDEKAREAFTESMRNIIFEQSLLGLCPRPENGYQIDPSMRFSFLLHGCDQAVKSIVKRQAEQVLPEMWTLVMDFETWMPK